MSDRTDRTAPAILVLKEVIRDYRAVNDPAGLGALLFPLEQCLSGEEYTPPKTGGELNTFNRLLDAARRGIESYDKMSRRGQAGAAATNAKRAQAANPSAPLPDTKPAPRAVYHTPAPQPVPRPVPAPSGAQARQGGSKSIGDSFGNLAALFGAGGGIEDRINAEPVRAALEITGETGNARAEGALNKYLRIKGAAAFTETLFQFHSEIKQGEDVENRGAAFMARIKALPDISDVVRK